MIQTFLWHEPHTEKKHFVEIRLGGKGSTPLTYSPASLLEREFHSRKNSMLLGSKQGYEIHPILEQTLLSFQGAAKDFQQEKAQGTDQNSPLISCDLPIN